MNSLNIGLVINPVAGNKAYKYIPKITSVLSKVGKLNRCITTKRGDAFEFAKSLRNCDRLIVASGDGTINEVINGLMNSDFEEARYIPIGLIPLGITNVLAKELSIPEKIDIAIEIALNEKPIDMCLGSINGTYFSLMAGIGFDGETVLNVKNDLIKKISGKLAHIIAGLKVFFRYSPQIIEIRTPISNVIGYTVVVANARCYGGHFYVTPEASVKKPELDICVLRDRSRIGLLRFIFGVLRGTHLKLESVYYEKVTEVKVSSKGKVHIQIDGDYYGTLPANIRSHPDAVRIIPGRH